MTTEEQKEALEEAGVKIHHRAGPGKIAAQYAEHFPGDRHDPHFTGEVDIRDEWLNDVDEGQARLIHGPFHGQIRSAEGLEDSQELVGPGNPDWAQRTRIAGKVRAIYKKIHEKVWHFADPKTGELIQ